MKTPLLAIGTLCLAVAIYAGAALAVILAVVAYVSLAVASAWLRGDKPTSFEDK